jgi:hypothetical protein
MKDLMKDDAQDESRRQRMEQRPADAEHRAAIAQLQVVNNQA